MTLPKFDSFNVGDEIPALTTPSVSRHTLALYCGASGDHNPIHVDLDFAKSSGLDDVIAHGMLTMGTVIRVVTDWLGDPGKITSYSARFTRPIPVPDSDEGATIKVTTKITELLENNQAVISISAIHNDVTVLAKTVVTVTLAS